MSIRPAISILIPHLRESANDQALRICLDCIASNTSVDYELVIEAVQTRRDIYEVCNRMVDKASAEWVVFGNSDVFMAPGWAEPMWEARQPDRIVTGVIVECGAIGVSHLNVHRNFGMTPAAFNRSAFERWVGEVWPMPGGEGWYFPSLHHRETFLAFGGFDLSKGGFPAPLDSDYWDRWRASGRQVQRVASYCYHLQQWSFKEEQEKAARYGR